MIDEGRSSSVVRKKGMLRGGIVRHFRGAVCSTALLASFAFPADAEERIKLLVPERYHDITRPRNRQEVLQVYGWLVDTKDGVTEREAKLIAQYEVVHRSLDEDFDISKPKIIESNEKEIRVRLPAKFSLMRPRSEFIVCVDKKDGRVTCAEEHK